MAFSTIDGWIDQAFILIQNELEAFGIKREEEAKPLAASTVAWVSRLKPLRVFGTFDGTGSAYSFLFTAISTNATAPWVADSSRVIYVEYPTGDQVRSIVPFDEYELYPSPETATTLRFTATTPASGTANIGVEYEVLNTVTASASTVPDNQEPAYEFILAAVFLHVYAAKFMHNTDRSMEGDSVNRSSKSDIALRLAKAYLARASLILGVSIADLENGVSGSSGGGASASAPPAGMWGDMDPTASGWGAPIYRNRRQR